MEKISNKQKMVKQVSILGIVGNFILVIFKLIVGIFSNSQSMIADALHSGEDMLSSIVSYIGFRISSKPIDQKHPYGYGKVEYIFSYLISIIMIFASITMAQSTISNYINGIRMVFNIWIIIVCIITIIIKTALYLYSNSRYKLTHNILIRAGRDDHRNDIFVTSTVLISAIFSKFGIYVVDYIFGIIISIFIAVVGIRIFRLSYRVLIDTNLGKEKIDALTSKINEYDCVERVDRIIGKPIGDKYVIILKLAMNKELNICKSHDLEKEIKNRLISENNYIHDIIIHVNPY